MAKDNEVVPETERLERVQNAARQVAANLHAAAIAARDVADSAARGERLEARDEVAATHRHIGTAQHWINVLERECGEHFALRGIEVGRIPRTIGQEMGVVA